MGKLTKTTIVAYILALCLLLLVSGLVFNLYTAGEFAIAVGAITGVLTVIGFKLADTANPGQSQGIIGDIPPVDDEENDA